MLDFFFHYKNVGRHILFLKKSKEKKIQNLDILYLDKLIVYFNIKDTIDLNNLSISNYFYFFKYYFGRIPFFSNYKYKFKLNISYYTFFVQFNFYKKDLFYPLYFFVNDIYYSISHNSLKKNIGINFLEFTVNDMNFFIEKKNSVGFFNLKDSINFKLFFKIQDNFNASNLFTLFKI